MGSENDRFVGRKLIDPLGPIWDTLIVETTIQIPDPILRRAKSVAARRGITLGAFVTEAIVEKLAAGARKEEKPWISLAGGLQHLHKETLHINKVMNSEFEKIEPEDWGQSLDTNVLSQ